MSKSAKKTLTLQEKQQLLNEVDAGLKSKTLIAAEFGIPNSTLSTILKNRAKIEAACATNLFEPARKRMRTAKHEEVEVALIRWIKKATSQNVTLTGAILQERARLFAGALNVSEFQGSYGWLQRFKERRGLVCQKVCGEETSCWTDAKSEVKKRYQLYLKNPSKAKQPSELDQRINSLIGEEDGKIIKKELTGENNSKSVVPQEPNDDLGIKIAFYNSIEPNTQAPASSTQEILQSSTCAPRQQSSENIESVAADPQSVDHPVATASNKNTGILSYQRRSAEALQAIAKELGVKNELTKRKLDLEERKVQAFEIIAKKLQK